MTGPLEPSSQNGGSSNHSWSGISSEQTASTGGQSGVFDDWTTSTDGLNGFHYQTSGTSHRNSVSMTKLGTSRQSSSSSHQTTHTSR